LAIFDDTTHALRLEDLLGSYTRKNAQGRRLPKASSPKEEVDAIEEDDDELT